MPLVRKIEIDDDFLEEVRQRENEKHYKILLPVEVVESNYCGDLYGYYVENTCTWNVIHTKENIKKFNNIKYVENICKIISEKEYMYNFILVHCSLLNVSDVKDFPELVDYFEKNNESITNESKETDKIKGFIMIGHEIVASGSLQCFLYEYIRNNDHRQVKKLYEIIERKYNKKDNVEELLKRLYDRFYGSKRLIGIRFSDRLEFYYLGESGYSNIKIEPYSFISDVFSRTKGILESDKMLQKKVVIVGCGSGGSFIALELAKSGIGHFLLSDNDIFGYHNISRHQCSIYDVGKRKVDALKERILAINPQAEVLVFNDMIQKIYEGDLDSFIDKNTIILSCGDNRGSAHHCNYLSEKYDVPFIAAGAGHRASTGEIFYYIPNTGMPCYSCVFGEDLSLDYSNEAQRVWYSTEEELEKQTFEPGLAADIDFISIIVCKMAIDLLNKDNGSSKVLHYLPQYTAVCNYLCDKEINPMIQIFQHPLQIKTKGLTTVKRDGCYLCRRISELKK